MDSNIIDINNKIENLESAPASIEELIKGKVIRLKSWKGDYLHRPDSKQGVTTWNTGIGNEWTVEYVKSDKKDNKDNKEIKENIGVYKLKSWKEDYLHRPDSNQGVTSLDSGIGNEWTIEYSKENNGAFEFKSWKGDYLHRPDSNQGVTSLDTGLGNQWTIEFKD